MILASATRQRQRQRKLTDAGKASMSVSSSPIIKLKQI